MEELSCFDKIECCECGDYKTCVDTRSLKPCPLCGKTELEPVDCTMDDPCYTIQCRNCNTTVYSGNNFLEAVEMWNTRAKQPLTLREALEWAYTDPNRFQVFIDLINKSETMNFLIDSITKLVRG